MKQYKWLIIGLVSILLATVNPTLIRAVSADNSVFLFNALRFGLIALICTPFIVRDKHLRKAGGMRFAILAALSMTLGTSSYVEAIKMSQASYISILALLSPIVLVIFSLRFTKDKINFRALTGVSIAALGAMVAVVLPLAFKEGTFSFYPLATFLGLLNTLFYPLSSIAYKKANTEHRVSIWALLGTTAWTMTITSFFLWVFVDGASQVTVNNTLVYSVLYSGLIVALVARVLNILVYEHIGAARIAALTYLESIITIMIPVFVLNEKLSIYMVLGGILILVGVVTVEHHKSIHHKHYHLFRHI